MTNNTHCAACGKENAGFGLGGVLLCGDCYPEIRVEIDRLRAAGNPVDVRRIAHDMRQRSASIGCAEFAELMDNSGTKGVDLARLCGTTPRAVSYWRTGDRPVPEYAVTILRLMADNRRLTNELQKLNQPG